VAHTHAVGEKGAWPPRPQTKKDNRPNDNLIESTTSKRPEQIQVRNPDIFSTSDRHERGEKFNFHSGGLLESKKLSDEYPIITIFQLLEI